MLLLFNAEDRLSYNDIKNQLNLTDEDIVRLLHSLSCAKYKILNKDPSTKMVGQNDTFEFNTKFTDKMRRIKVTYLCSFDQSCSKYIEVYVRSSYLQTILSMWDSEIFLSPNWSRRIGVVERLCHEFLHIPIPLVN